MTRLFTTIRFYFVLFILFASIIERTAAYHIQTKFTNQCPQKALYMQTRADDNLQNLNAQYLLSFVFLSAVVGLSFYDNSQISTLREEVGILKAQVDINRENLDSYILKTRDLSKTVNYGSAFGSATLTILTTAGTALSIRGYFDSKKSNPSG